MKRISILLALCLMSATFAMEKKTTTENPDTPFAQEGLVETDPADNPAGVLAWSYYDGSRVKAMMFPHFKSIVAENKHVIIKRKFGAEFLEYFKQHENTSYPFTMQPIIRYAHAVCWRLLGDKTVRKPETTDALQRAERQIPLNIYELVYIMKEDNHGTKDATELVKSFKNKSHAEQRKHLNEFLTSMKERTLTQK